MIKPYRTIFCSPTSAKLRLFGSDAFYSKDLASIEFIIKKVNEEEVAQVNAAFRNLVKNQLPFIGCSELSLLAHENNIECMDSMEIALEYIVKEVI